MGGRGGIRLRSVSAIALAPSGWDGLRLEGCGVRSCIGYVLRAWSSTSSGARKPPSALAPEAAICQNRKGRGEGMSISVSCRCGNTFQVPDENAGRTGNCMRCGTLLTVPKSTPLPQGHLAYDDDEAEAYDDDEAEAYDDDEAKAYDDDEAEDDDDDERRGRRGSGLRRAKSRNRSGRGHTAAPARDSLGDRQGGSKGRNLLVAAMVVSVASVFLNWVEIGIVSASGFQQEAYWLLLLFVYPGFCLARGSRVAPIGSLVCGGLGIAMGIAYVASKQVELLGRDVNAAGPGPVVFMGACAMLCVGAYMQPPAS